MASEWDSRITLGQGDRWVRRISTRTPSTGRCLTESIESIVTPSPRYIFSHGFKHIAGSVFLLLNGLPFWSTLLIPHLLDFFTDEVLLGTVLALSLILTHSFYLFSKTVFTAKCYLFCLLPAFPFATKNVISIQCLSVLVNCVISSVPRVLSTLSTYSAWLRVGSQKYAFFKLGTIEWMNE